MEVLLLGVGMQGRAALHDLVRSPGVARVTAADVVRVARRLLAPARMRVAAVGPQVAREETVIRKAVDAFARS